MSTSIKICIANLHRHAAEFGVQPAEVEQNLLVEIVVATRPDQVERRLVEFAQIVSCNRLVVSEEVQRLARNLPVSCSLCFLRPEDGIAWV